MFEYNKTFLIVEDEESDRILIERAFRANGATCPIQSVNDGNEAIAYLMGEGKYSDRDKFPFPSFIMTDLKMPNGDGFSVLEHLKRNPEWAIVPAVVLTGSEDPDDIKKAYMLGASSYHVKPNNNEDLRKQMKVLHDYWMTARIPAVDLAGRHVMTESKGKLGERFPQTKGGTQTRQPH